MMTKRLCLPRLLSRTHLIAGVLLMVLFSGLLIWSLRSKSPASPPGPAGTWITVQAGRLENNLGLVGNIQAVHQATLAAPFNGVIRDILVQEGQSVTTGQTLIHLDPSQIEIQLRQAQADLLKAQRELDQLQHWDSSPEVARARRTMNAAQATLSNAQANLRDTQALFERGIVARMEVDTQTQQVQSQQQSLVSAQEELRLLEARGKGEELKIAEMSLTNAQARYQDLVTQIEQQDLKSPFNGFIVPPDTTDNGKPLILRTGLAVNQGTPLFRVVGLERIQVQTQVSEIDVHQLQTGMPVHISGDGFQGHTLQGHIASIALQSSANSGRGINYDVRVAVDTPITELQDKIRLGMSAKLIVSLWHMDHAIAIPAHALQRDASGNTYVIWRATKDNAEQHLPVTTGRAVLQGVYIEGVTTGEVFIPG